jgi:hypothetical protein
VPKYVFTFRDSGHVSGDDVSLCWVEVDAGGSGILTCQNESFRRIRYVHSIHLTHCAYPRYLNPFNMSASVVEPSDLPASAANKTVFLTGSTGYIGGTVLHKLLTLPTPPKSISLLIRDPTKAALLAEIPTNGTKLNAVIGSLEDLELLERSVQEVDVVVSTANADDLLGMQAMLRGMKARKEKIGHRSVLIQTSGTGVLIDNARGQYPGNKVCPMYG